MGSLLWTSLTHTYTACEFLIRKTIPLIGSHAVMDLMLLKKKGTVTTLSLPQNSQSRCDLCRMHWTGSVHMSKHLWREQTDKQSQKTRRPWLQLNQHLLQHGGWFAGEFWKSDFKDERSSQFVFSFFHDKIREQCAQSWELSHCFLCGELLCLLVSLNRYIKAS